MEVISSTGIPAEKDALFESHNLRLENVVIRAEGVGHQGMQQHRSH